MSVALSPMIEQEKLAAIDATRGWAIILVMLVHSLAILPELPWPVVKIGSFGWYGVQLFFIASALTLLLSWHRQTGPLPTKIGNFFIRRFFRIAPMYYFAALIYLYLRPPGQLFEIEQMLLTLGFLNGWSPDWMGTTEGTWQVVPGGWSISVEFSFYLAFPLLALYLTTLQRSISFLLASLFIMAASHQFAAGLLIPRLGEDIAGNFLFFWFPNQLIVFSLGFLIFHIITSPGIVSHTICASFRKHGREYLLLAVILFLSLTQIGPVKTLTTNFPWLPTHVLVSVLFAVALMAVLLAERPLRLYSNRLTQSLGEVSFSAYLVHWAVIDFLRYMGSIGIYDTTITGFQAIAEFIPAFVCVVAITFVISRVTYRFIEKPFIAISKQPWLVARLAQR